LTPLNALLGQNGAKEIQKGIERGWVYYNFAKCRFQSLARFSISVQFKFERLICNNDKFAFFIREKMSDLPDMVVTKGCAAVEDQCTDNNSSNNLEGVADFKSLVRFQSERPNNNSFFEKVKENLRILGVLHFLKSIEVRNIHF